MKQYVLPRGYDDSGSLVVKGDDFHYLTRVLRKREGDRLDGLDPSGRQVTVLIRAVHQEGCVLDIVSREGNTSTGSPRIILFQCLPKGRKMDLIVRQATETGIAKVVPLLSARSVPLIKPEESEKKRERWRRIARQAMQQSGCPSVPEIIPPAPFANLGPVWDDFSEPQDIGLFFHPEPIEGMGLHSYLASAPKRVGICVGPEGGFSDEEVNKLLQSGFQPVYISTNVLRTETAALYAIASVQTVLREKDCWNPQR